jgi:DNA-directed RNA polymerase subunit RPC12/RpoP
MDECDFFTRRVPGDGSKAVVWVPKGTQIVNVLYVCAQCKKAGEVTQEYVKPIVFNCQHCGVKIKIAALKKSKGTKKKSD